MRPISVMHPGHVITPFPGTASDSVLPWGSITNSAPDHGHCLNINASDKALPHGLSFCDAVSKSLSQYRRCPQLPAGTDQKSMAGSYPACGPRYHICYCENTNTQELFRYPGKPATADLPNVCRLSGGGYGVLCLAPGEITKCGPQGAQGHFSNRSGWSRRPKYTSFFDNFTTRALLCH